MQRKLLAIIILTGIIISLSSCAPTPQTDALCILNRAAQFNIEGVRNGVKFSAILTLGEVGEDGSRCGEISFSAPDAFAALTVRTNCGVWEAEIDGVKISGDAARALGAPLAPFMRKSSAVGAELIKSGSEAQTLITVPSEGGKIEFSIDKNGHPISLREKNSADDTIMEFKITEFKTK